MKLKLKHRIMLAFLAISLLPLTCLGLWSLYSSSNALELTAYQKLEAVREIKKQQIQQYFFDRQKELSMLVQSTQRISHQQDLKELSHTNHDYFSSFISTYGYYDLFLISPQGDVFYTVTKESDYQTNLISGVYRSSGLAKLFIKTTTSMDSQIQDFSPYEPSQGAPAGFIAAPLVINNQLVAVIALQLSIDTIDLVMQERHGMGETGESYLVGGDFKMRSSSFLDPIGHSVVASFAGTIERNGVDTEAVRLALRGETNAKIIKDYNGNNVLSAFTPLAIDGVNWVLLSEIDEIEALAPVFEMQKMLMLITLVTGLIVIYIAYLLSRNITHPIGGEPEAMAALAETIAAGDLTHQFEEADQSSGILLSMRKMSINLNNLIKRISDVTLELASAASQSSVTAEQSNVSLQEQQVNIESVSSAMHEMTMTIHEVSTNAAEVAIATDDMTKASLVAKSHVQQTIDSVNTLAQEISSANKSIETVNNKSQQIGTILEVIRSIADQTNLLALNAAIEAARAGDQGRGFAVVADEVRQLAHKTQLSTTDIEEMISHLQTGVSDVVHVMERNSRTAKETIVHAQETADSIALTYQSIEKISANAQHIATAAQQQSQASEEISQSLVSINDVAKQNAIGVTEISSSSIHLSNLGHDLKSLTSQFSTN